MNIKRIELLAVVSVAIATIAIAASMMAPQKAGAHTSDLGFKWFNNGYDYENVEIMASATHGMSQAAYGIGTGIPSSG